MLTSTTTTCQWGMKMSGNPTPPPSNVVPMPTNWPGPMFNPGARSWPTPPSCFSELAGLNACYDSVQMMEQILAKVVCDLATNNAAFAQCLVEAIAKSGSNVPLIGVTNGTDAQPGQVGEFVLFNQSVAFATGTNTQFINMGTLQPGDWDLWSWLSPGSVVLTNVGFNLSPAIAGFSNLLGGASWAAGANAAQSTVIGTMCRGSISAATPLVFTMTTEATAAGTAAFQVEARRAR